MAFVFEVAGVRAGVVPLVVVGGVLADRHKDDGVAGLAGEDSEVHAALEGEALAMTHVLVREDLVEAGHGGSLREGAGHWALGIGHWALGKTTDKKGLGLCLLPPPRRQG